MVDFNGNRLYFFYFDLDFMHYINLLGGIHEYFGKKIFKPRWYSWSAKKKSWNHLGIRLGPRASAPALGPSLGARWVSIYFIFELHEYHQSFKFSCQKIREYPQNFQKINEIQVQK